MVDDDLYDELEPSEDGERYSWGDVVEELEEPRMKKLARKIRKRRDDVVEDLDDAIEENREQLRRSQGFAGGDTEEFRERIRELEREKRDKKQRFADRVDEIRDEILEIQEEIEKLEDIKPVDELL
ncbi:hypothetical protein [Halapricum desulfuricans]|uniref:hypothetical protein n=1 Tax=Halapricum desulfuricans TaxID=2841257 RepID=UPI001E550970|nr:hypothetical protein [Halapricum desulfuricans]